jgi:hypothetical protein
LTDNLPMHEPAEPFSSESVPENRAGRLTSDQARRFQRVVDGRRRGTRGLAVPVAAIGALLLILSGPAANASTRHLAGLVFVAEAGVILAAPAFDPFAADVREGRVESIEGPIGKTRRQSATASARTRYYLNVGGRQLRTYKSDYDAAPDGGYVRAYYLPRMRRLVNLERLPNPAVPTNPGQARDMFGRMARAFATGDRAGFAEARADAAGLIDAIQAATIDSPAMPPQDVTEGLAREALVGKWTHPLATVTFAADGTATVTTILGATQRGHWSIDHRGRLLTDVTGAMAPMDAALEAGRLTIQLEQQRLTFTRATGV